MSMPSFSIQIDDGLSIPYHEGMNLGQAVHFTLPFEPNNDGEFMNTEPITSRVDSLTCKFSLVESFNDVCDVLDIPPEYALRVKTGTFRNAVVSACLDDIYNKHALKLIVRLRYIKELRHFLEPLSLNNGTAEMEQEDGVKLETEELSEAQKLSPGYVVEAVCVGDELVTIVNIAASDSDALSSFRKKIQQTFEDRTSGSLTEDVIISTLKSLGKSIDSKLSKNHYSNVKRSVFYATFPKVEGDGACYPACLSGMCDVINRFVTNWRDDSSNTVLCDQLVCDMEIIQGKESAGLDSITSVQSCEARNMFNLRVTLQPRNNKGDSQRSLDESLNLYERIFKSMYTAFKTQLSIKDFLREHSLFSNHKYIKEGKEVQDLVDFQTKAVCDVINANVTISKNICAEDVEIAWDMVKNLPTLVGNFIEKVTTKLPEGENINLLIIGKTGHGKSSTANSILRRPAFKTSSGAISETKSCQCAWAETDERVFQVVDVPGVCDTDLDSVDSAKLAMNCISEAITTCSSGFHALLLVIRYGNRMTEEEERAIYILKCILGASIISTHCICVVTHGDNFDEGTTFNDWCHKQTGFLKEVFEECHHRCVLFNNKTSDPSVMKTQLIELVSLVDNIENRGSCYTNDIFKHAKQDRERLLQELQLPQFKEDILRDVSLIQGAFEDCQNASGNQKQAELEKLKTKCEELRSKLDDVKCSGISDLYQAVSGLGQQIHRQEERDVAEAQLELERQHFQEEQESSRIQYERSKEESERLEKQRALESERRMKEAAEKFRMEQEKAREERIAIEKQLALETEKRIKEAAEKERQLEEYRKNFRRKKSRWVTFRDSVFK